MIDLNNFINQSCPHCGQAITPYEARCATCGKCIELQEESLNFCETASVSALHKIPVEEAEHLVRLRQARNRLRLDEACPQYHADVEDVLATVASALDLYESEFMKLQLKTMQPAAARIYHRIAGGAAAMEEGLQRMLSYQPGQSIAIVDAGLAQVEAALWKIDAAQDAAIEAASQNY